MVERRIMFPAGISPGVIIGKGGCNIKSLQSRSMARFAVQDTCVVISGTAAAVEAGEAMLQLQFDAHRMAGGAYPHPAEVQYILSAEFGDPVSAEFRARAGDETTEATHRREQMHHLCPSKRTSTTRQTSSAYADVSSLTSMMAGASLGRSVNSNGKADGTFHGHADVDIVATCLASATVKAMTTLPRMDVLKLRFNFGKALFYNDRYMSSTISVNTPLTLSRLKLFGALFCEDIVGANYDFLRGFTVNLLVLDVWKNTLEAFRIGQDLKSVFSNGATSGQVRLVTEWLENQGFTRAPDKHSVSIHVGDVNANSSYNICMEVAQPGNVLSVRKLKTASTKVCFATSVRPQDQLDTRFKILGHYSTQISPALEAKLRRVPQLARFDQARKCLDLPNLESMGLTLNHRRIKSKQVFLGTLKQAGAEPISIKISVVTCDTENGKHTEIQGVCEPLNDVLLRLHAAGHGSIRAAGEVKAVMPRILAWCDSLSQALV